MKNASTFFTQGTRRPGRSRRSGHGSRCPCFTDAGQPRPAVVVKIQCSLIQCSPSEELAARSVRASIAFVSPQRPRKHGVCYDTARRLPGLCPGTLCPGGGASAVTHEARRGPQEPPQIRPRQIPAPETRGQQRANAEAWRAILCHAASSRRKRRERAASRQQEQPPHGGPGVRICTHIRTGRSLAAGCLYKSQK